MPDDLDKVQQIADSEGVARERVADTSDDSVTMAFGQKVKAKPLAQVMERYRDPGALLYQPEKLLKPECYEPSIYKYVWPLKDDPALHAHIRAGRYIKVRQDELRKDCTISTHKGTATDVEWYDHIMCKMPLSAAYEVYEFPQEVAASRLLRSNEEDFQDRLERASAGRVKVESEIRNV